MTRLGWLGHPYEGKLENLDRAKSWLRWLLRTFSRIDFAADWILWCEVLDDAIPEDRARGLRFDTMMINRLTDYWMVGGKISNGMEIERLAAVEAGCEVMDLTCLGSQPPALLGMGSWWNKIPEQTQQRLVFLLSDEMVRKVEERL